MAQACGQDVILIVGTQPTGPDGVQPLSKGNQ
jgi:hypothetical protein